MNYKIELFSDYFTHRENIFTLIDARLKLVFVLFILSLVLFSNRISLMFAVTFLCLISLLLVQIPFKMLVVRLASPLSMALVILILQGIFFGKSALYSFDFSGFSFHIYHEGINRGLLIAGRIIAGTSLMLFLSMTTSLNKLLAALKFFRIPNGWIEIATFSYRFIFIFIEEAQSVMDAQRLRLGYKGIRNRLHSWGALVGALFVKVYDQANTTYNSMVLRGYNGVLYIQKPERITNHDFVAGSAMLVLCLLLLLLAFYGG
ncbi:MAG: cobalt ECF transporter T component CbiQ [Firmicutes bacterium]|nr:cobalt ECF transporter T component CbiQ [Bacillota bacterium]